MGCELILSGLDGSNPLAFLAALGVLRIFDNGRQTGLSGLKWVREDSWKPAIVTESPLARDSFLEELGNSLDLREGHEAIEIADNLSISSAEFREKCMSAVQTSTKTCRARVDFLASFGCDGVSDKKNIQNTALRLLSGQGHQHLLLFMRNIIHDTKTDHLSKALFEAWVYDDPMKNHTLRWDPLDDVQYALRWKEPSTDRDRDNRGSVWGANRLAIEGLPLLPTAPVGTRLQTTGFTRRGKPRTWYWTWPIWEVPLSIDPIRSLLTLDELQKSKPNRTILKKMGVGEVFRCTRISVGKFLNFTPSQPA
jgi:hypothetical protein